MAEPQLVAVNRDAMDRLIAGQAPGLRLPEGGLGLPDVIAMMRDAAETWMIVVDSVIAGLCGFMDAPEDAKPEIGYGVSPGCRGRGLARRAVRLMQALARSRSLAGLTAHSALSNPASGAVLARAEFVEMRRSADPERGTVIHWEWLV